MRARVAPTPRHSTGAPTPNGSRTSSVVQWGVAAATDLFARHNRARIVAVVLIAACNYVLSVAVAAVAIALSLVLLAIFRFEIWPDSVAMLQVMGYGIAGISAVAFVVGFCTALVRIPFARRDLERRVLAETGATVVVGDSDREIRNLLDGLAIAAGIPPPRYAVISDPAPNSFGVGTKPSKAIVAVTTGLSDVLTATSWRPCWPTRSRDPQLRRRARQLDRRADGGCDRRARWRRRLGVGRRRLRTAPARRVAAGVGVRDQGADRDHAAVRFTRNPASLLRRSRSSMPTRPRSDASLAPPHPCGSSSPRRSWPVRRPGPPVVCRARCSSTSASPRSTIAHRVLSRRQLLDVHAGDAAGDHEALDLGGAFEDRVARFESSGQSAQSTLVGVHVRASRRIQADSTRCRDERDVEAEDQFEELAKGNAGLGRADRQF